MRKNNDKNDYLARKTEEYAVASQEAESAVSMVTTAMNRMKAANQKMKDSMEEIDAYCARMIDVRDSINKSYTHNEAVIANFSKLLCIEE